MQFTRYWHFDMAIRRQFWGKMEIAVTQHSNINPYPANVENMVSS
jgi:hypothetical protein